MGKGNKLIVGSSGFPMTNKTLRFLQDGFREPLGALAKLAGEKTIVSGVAIADTAVGDGYIVFEGEIIPFLGGVLGNNVAIIEMIESVSYNTDADNDSVLDNRPAYRTRWATCDDTGIAVFAFSELKRLKTMAALSDFELPNGLVVDPNYVHTDNNFSNTLINKLNEIEAAAEKNVQANFATTEPTDDSFIKNNPILRKGSTQIGNISPIDMLKTINFGSSVGATSYMVICSFVSQQINNSTSAGWDRDNDFSYVICNKTATSFGIGLRNLSDNVLNLRVDYILIAL